jgi:hypothetical protein
MDASAIVVGAGKSRLSLEVHGAATTMMSDDG